MELACSAASLGTEHPTGMCFILLILSCVVPIPQIRMIPPSWIICIWKWIVPFRLVTHCINFFRFIAHNTWTLIIGMPRCRTNTTSTINYSETSLLTHHDRSQLGDLLLKRCQVLANIYLIIPNWWSGSVSCVVLPLRCGHCPKEIHGLSIKLV